MKGFRTKLKKNQLFYRYSQQDTTGMIVCRICGKSYYHLGVHIRVHKISGREYKVKFGLTNKTALVTSVIGEKLRKAVKINEKKIKKNLQSKKSNRFKKGHTFGYRKLTNLERRLRIEHNNLYLILKIHRICKMCKKKFLPTMFSQKYCGSKKNKKSCSYKNLLRQTGELRSKKYHSDPQFRKHRLEISRNSKLKQKLKPENIKKSIDSLLKRKKEIEEQLKLLNNAS